MNENQQGTVKQNFLTNSICSVSYGITDQNIYWM